MRDVRIPGGLGAQMFCGKAGDANLPDSWRPLNVLRWLRGGSLDQTAVRGVNGGFNKG